jgi:hypothetical protein
MEVRLEAKEPEDVFGNSRAKQSAFEEASNFEVLAVSLV